MIDKIPPGECGEVEDVVGLACPPFIRVSGTSQGQQKHPDTLARVAASFAPKLAYISRVVRSLSSKCWRTYPP
jgi:hypothetical protein